MKTKRLPANTLEKAAEAFRKSREDALSDMYKKIEDINESLAISTRTCQQSVADIWTTYRQREISLTEAHKRVSDVWIAHKKNKTKARAAIAAAKSAYRNARNKTFEYAGYTPS